MNKPCLIIGISVLGRGIKKEGRDLGKVKDLSPDAIKLGFDFATAIKRRGSMAAFGHLEQIEILSTIWRNFDESSTP